MPKILSTKELAYPLREVAHMEDLTPRQIVAELDKYIVGQDKAKRAVAIALRNRYRRRGLSFAIPICSRNG